MKFVFTILLICIFTCSQAQNSLGGIGQWRSHYSNRNIQHIVEGEDIYVAGQNQIIKLDQKLNLSWLDKSTGLHDIGIANLTWDGNNKQLLVTYQNSNIDILKDDQVFNINAIQLTSLYPNKKINSIKLYNNWALLSTAFGIVVIDLLKHEIKDNWFPSSSNQPTITYDISIINDSVYAATENGVWKSKLNYNSNSIHQWQRLAQYDQLNIQHFVQNNALVYGYNNSNVYQLPITTPVFSLQSSKIQHVASTENGLTICIRYPNHKGALLTTNNNFLSTVLIDSNYLSNPTQSLLDKQQRIWIADSSNGLLLKTTNLQWLKLGGPQAAIGGNLFVNEHFIIAPFGDNEKGYALFNGKEWENYGNYGTFQLPNLYTATSSTTEQNLWFTTKDKILNINSNKTPEWVQPNSLNGNYYSIKTNSNNHIWAIQDQQGLVNYDNKIWSSIPIPNQFIANGLRNFISTKQGQAWIIAPNQHGIYIYQSNEVYTTPTWKQLGTQSNNGNLNSMNVLSAAEDKTGAIWVGTDNGIAIFNCGDISNEPCNAYLPIVRNNGFNGYLFQHEIVHCIAIDGANRKWIGSNKGAWLLSEDGMNIIAHFTKDNSPLPYDTITQILIEPNTGEVFFKSAEQLVSYRGTATAGIDKQGAIQIYPNPVSSSFVGNIAIRGLVDNAIVKIADLTGKLVYQTIALGGQAIWNGRTYEGNKVATGIYLVFVRDTNGSEQAVGKIAIADGY